MTDSTPPSIPPRKRPTTPTTAGRQTTSAPRAGSDPAWSEPSPTTPATHVPTPERLAARSTVVHGAGQRDAGDGEPDAHPDVRVGARTSQGRPTQRHARREAGTPPPRHLHRIVTRPAPATGDEHDPPSPMMVAVDTATVWLKKAGVATSAAFAAATRPRPKEPSMTTTPAAAPAASPAPRTATSSDNLTGARPSTGRIPTVGPHGAPRRVRLAISRVDPWSVMKLSFLLSVAIGVMIVVAAAVSGSRSTGCRSSPRSTTWSRRSPGRRAGSTSCSTSSSSGSSPARRSSRSSTSSC